MSKGHTVVGYNRTRDKAKWLVDRGMTLAETPRAVAESPTPCSSWSPTRPRSTLSRRT
jgi:hypothetical protein